MRRDFKIDYHLRELKIAEDPKSPSHVLPDFSDGDRCVLDIGCGIGQILSTMVQRNDRLVIGLDLDFWSLEFGRNRFDHIEFVNGAAESLPFRDGGFDFVFSRVSLPYTNIPEALSEIARVLKPNGRVWLTLHPFSMLLRNLKNSFLMNGISLSVFCKQFPLPFNGKYESVQFETGIVKALKIAGFENIRVDKGRHFVVTGRRNTHVRLDER